MITKEAQDQTCASFLLNRKSNRTRRDKDDECRDKPVD
jgi:hypothetical protein